MGPPDKKKGGEGKIPATPEKNALPATYTASILSATEIAPLVVARRYRLTLPVAHLVCELANIGGRAAH